MLIPDRNLDAKTGSQFIKDNLNLKGQARENNILQEFLSGNIPDFMRKFVPITINEKNNSIVYLVMPDYLSIGSDDDYVRVPMMPLTAQIIADKYDCTLPTRKMVNDIWKHATNKLEPLPGGPPYDDSMSYTNKFTIHNDKIQQQLTDKDKTQLTAGNKKDIILTNKLHPNNVNKKVAIFGWHKSDGTPIQKLNATSHSSNFMDYSHGVRLIANDVILNGNLIKIQNIFEDSVYHYLISDEGVLNFTRY